jgi:hypothetical protein
MKTSYLTVVLTLTCLLGLGAVARAQGEGNVVVNVPFEFVAGGSTLPAGTYNISRVFSQTNQGLVIRSYDNSAFLLPIVSDGASVDRAKLAFEHVDGKYFLSKIETPAGIYTLGIPRAMTKLAQGKDHDAMSSSGTN